MSLLLLHGVAFGQTFIITAPSGQTIQATVVGGVLEVSQRGAIPVTGSLVLPGSYRDGNITYPVARIGSFAGTGVTSVTIPNSVTFIGSGAFEGCSSLAAVVMGDSVEVIADNAFYHCTALDSLELSPLLRTIGCQAFEGCSGLMGTIVIPDSVRTLSPSAFRECRNVQGVVVGNSVRTVGEECFAVCDSLSSVVLGIAVDTLARGAFSFCGNLSTLVLPASLRCIGYGAFEECGGLGSVVIPDSVRAIGPFAFRRCLAMRRVVVGQRVDSIGRSSFGQCGALDTVEMRPLAPPDLGLQAFAGTPDNMVIRVACGSGEAYCSAWGRRYNISEKVPEIVVQLEADDTLHGDVLTIGSVHCDSTVVVMALPRRGFRFEAWSNGSTANPDTLLLVGDTALTAFFETEEYTVAVSSNRLEWGTVEGGGQFPFGTEIVLTATPQQGCSFSQWDDGNVDNPRFVVVESDTAFLALFRPSNAVPALAAEEVKAYASGGTIVVENALGRGVEVSDAKGCVVYVVPCAGQKVVVPVPSRGVYFVKVGGVATRKIAVGL